VHHRASRSGERTVSSLATAIAGALKRSPVLLVSAYLFGSQAEGRAHRESDVDVGVLLPRGEAGDARERFDARVELTSYLIGELHRNDVDVVVLNDAPPQFARRIVTGGRRILRNDPAADHDSVRDVQLRAAHLEPFLRRARRTKLSAISR
jgi:predicted nucleotidyltransferase